MTCLPDNLKHTRWSGWICRKKYFPQIASIISRALFFTFVPDNLVYFYTKNANNLKFSSNCPYNMGQFLTVVPIIIVYFWSFFLPFENVDIIYITTFFLLYSLLYQKSVLRGFSSYEGRVEHQKLNQTAALLSFGWVCCFQLDFLEKYLITLTVVTFSRRLFLS